MFSKRVMPRTKFGIHILPLFGLDDRVQPLWISGRYLSKCVNARGIQPTLEDRANAVNIREPITFNGVNITVTTVNVYRKS